MSNATTPSGLHLFEKAGLGKAPFRVMGVSNKVGPIRHEKNGITYEVGSPGQPMGCCEYCGQGIKECWSIKSSDGNVFDVGCECVTKTGDAGLTNVVNAHKAKINREKRKDKGNRDREFVDETLADASAAARLAAMPHPRAAINADYFGSLTALDYAAFMRKNSGNAGLGRLVKWLRATLNA